jgi:hypothetical protein
MATITLTYRSYTIASPTVISATTATVNVPATITPDQHVQNIFRFGAFTFSDATGLYTYIPAREVTKITSP